MPLQTPARLPLASPARSHHHRRRGFSLVELLIVIGIIALLISILVPVIGRVRIAGQTTDTAALIRAIDNACQTYHSDHQAWPGPLSNGQMGIGAPDPVPGVVPGPADGFYRTGIGGGGVGVTGSENLVLGLLGGLVPYDDDSDPSTPAVIAYDPAAVGRGPTKLGGRSPGGSSAYFDARDENLSMHAIGDPDVTHAGASSADGGMKWGRFVEESAAAQDSIIPEFVDRYSDPLPILYMRARPTGRITEDNIAVRIISDDPADNPVFMHSEIDPYIVPPPGAVVSIGIGKNPEEAYHVSGAKVNTVPGSQEYYHGLQLDVYPGGITAPTIPPAPGSLQYMREMNNKGSASYTYPYDARAYFLSPSEATARQADRYVLISAGPDRVYGTEDDVTNFGKVP